MSEKPTKAVRAKAQELCVGSVHGERGAIECNCDAIAEALMDARESVYVRPKPPRYDEVYYRGIADLFGDD